MLFAGLLLLAPAYAQVKTTLVVALDGSGDYSSIQEAVTACGAFPAGQKEIFIKNGPITKRCWSIRFMPTSPCGEKAGRIPSLPTATTPGSPELAPSTVTR